MKIVFAQDIHFSQPFVDRMYFNPAKVGDIIKDDLRFSIQRKSQWKSVSNPFSSLSSSFEHKNIYKNFNLGISFINDKSGSSSLTLNQLNIAISKEFKLGNVNALSVGLLTGFGEKSIDYSELIFEENENFITNKLMFPDISLGINYQTNDNKILSYEFGFSSYHLNNPNNSFNKNENTKLPIKNNFNMGISYQLSTAAKIVSELIYTKQSSQKEMLIGIKPIIEIDEVYFSPLVYYRINDAAIIGFGIEKNNFQANICYDINVSNLIPASNYKGGFEFSIIYVWKKTKDKKTKQIEEKCPKYL